MTDATRRMRRDIRENLDFYNAIARAEPDSSE